MDPQNKNTDNAETDETPVEETEEQAAEQQSSTDESPKGSEEDGSQEDESGDDDERNDDPEWLRAQLKEARKDAAARRIAARKANEALSKAKSPEEYDAAVEEFNQKIESLEREITIRDVSDTLGIPADLRPLLTGNTEEEIKASAELLSKHVSGSRDISDDDLGGGLGGGGDEGSMDPGQLARMYPRR